MQAGEVKSVSYRDSQTYSNILHLISPLVFFPAGLHSTDLVCSHFGSACKLWVVQICVTQDKTVLIFVDVYVRVEIGLVICKCPSDKSC